MPRLVSLLAGLFGYKKLIAVASSCALFCMVMGQELFVFSEPASNMPARSLSLKMGSMVGRDDNSGKLLQRHTPELMFGLSKKWMIHTSTTFSDLDGTFGWEAIRAYAKFRFLSLDQVHSHFRMATFATAVYSRADRHHSELTVLGDHSAVQIGLIATQLLQRLAVSATGSLVEAVDKSRWKEPPLFPYRSVNYSFSAGYLVLPRTYTDYQQTNLNIYCELLGSRFLDWQGAGKFYVDIAPSAQIIINSASKINFSYRFQVAGDMNRMMTKWYMISLEHIFLNALKKNQDRKPKI